MDIVQCPKWVFEFPLNCYKLKLVNLNKGSLFKILEFMTQFIQRSASAFFSSGKFFWASVQCVLGRVYCHWGYPIYLYLILIQSWKRSWQAGPGRSLVGYFSICLDDLRASPKLTIFISFHFTDDLVSTVFCLGCHRLSWMSV